MNEKTYDCDCGRLEPFKRNVTLEDIRKGDLVRVEYTQNDFTSVRTGVADARLSTGWYTPRREFLPMSGAEYAVTILSRPEPEPELPTTPGAVIKIWLGADGMRVNLGADGYWRGAWPDGDDMEATGDKLIDVYGTYWDRFEVVA